MKNIKKEANLKIKKSISKTSWRQKLLNKKNN